jgi:hypothetical protein
MAGVAAAGRTGFPAVMTAGPAVATRMAGGWPGQDPRLTDGQDLGPDREPETAGARPVPFLTGPEPTYLTGPDSGSLAEPRSGDVPVSKPAVGEARMADDTSPLPVIKADGPPPSPPGLSEAASADPHDRPGDTYRPEHAEPPSADTQEKIEQIKDLYLTAEAIGEDALGKHFDQLSQRQRSLIREFFEKAGLGSSRKSKLRNGDSAQDKSARGKSARDKSARDKSARDKSAHDNAPLAG